MGKWGNVRGSGKKEGQEKRGGAYKGNKNGRQEVEEQAGGKRFKIRKTGRRKK